MCLSYAWLSSYILAAVTCDWNSFRALPWREKLQGNTVDKISIKKWWFFITGLNHRTFFSREGSRMPVLKAILMYL